MAELKLNWFELKPNLMIISFVNSVASGSISLVHRQIGWNRDKSAGKVINVLVVLFEIYYKTKDPHGYREAKHLIQSKENLILSGVIIIDIIYKFFFV